MDQKQELIHIYPPLASTERGRPSRISASKTQLLYTVSNVVVIRQLADLTKCVLFDKHKFDTTAVAVSPNGEQCCSGDARGNILIWEINVEGNPVYKQYDDQLGGAIRDICWTSDGQRIIVCGEGKTFYAKAFLVDTGSSVGEIGGVGKQLLSCDVRPQRPFRLIVGGEEFSVCWYEGPPFKFKKSSKQHTNFVFATRFSPNGDFFVTSSSDKRIFLYDGKTGDEIKEITTDLPHTRSVTEISWINDTTFVTSSNDTTLKVWNIDGLQKTLIIPNPLEIDDMQVTVKIVGNDCYSIGLAGTLNVFRDIQNILDGGHPTERYHGHIGPVVSMATFKEFLITGDTKGKILVWKDNQATAITGPPHTKAVNGLQVSQKGDKLFSLGGEELKLTNLITYQVEKTVECKGQVLMLQSSQSNDDIVYVLFENGIILEFTNLEITNEIKLGYEVSCFDVGIDSILVGDLKGNIHQLVDGKEIDSWKVLNNKVTRVTIQGDRFICGDITGKMRLWDYREKKELFGERWTYHSTIISSLSFSNSGKQAVSTAQDNKIMVWDLENGQRVLEKNDAHKRGVLTGIINGSNEVITSGGDCGMKVWKII